MYCPQCGTANDDSNVFCERCGQIMETPRPAPAPIPPVEAAPPRPSAPYPSPPTTDNTMGGLIPYKNPSALTAYYLGVFSLFPCLGIILGIAAFILGLKGLRFAKEHPETKGVVHAWIGIVVGGLCGFGQLLFLLFMLFSMNSSR